MTKTKKKVIMTIVTCLVGVVGGLLFGEFGSHHEPLLAAMAVIVTFGIGICLILMYDMTER